VIEEETVLIIGAGGSMPYHFPSGQTLLEDVCERCANPNEKSPLVQLGVPPPNIVEFVNALARSGAGSVDEFLEHRPDFIKVGRLAIAQSLIRFENDENLFAPSLTNDQHWYKYLFSKMRSSFEDFNHNKVSFVTFNYDRSLEQYLGTVLGNLHGKSDDEVGEKLSQMDFIHVHGQLGYLPWQGEDDQARIRTYGNVVTADHVERAASTIRIISEASEADESFAEARQLINSARFVYFLGFGYNPKNLERLQVGDRAGSVYGTAYERTLLEIETICEDSDKALRIDHLIPKTIVPFFRENIDISKGRFRKDDA